MIARIRWPGSWALLAVLITSLALAQTSAAPSARVEARSPDLLAVGTVQGNRMAVRLSRVVDNAPIGNAALAVMLRGTTHPAVAEADGSYSVETPDLQLSGPASVEFLVTVGDKREELKGTLAATAAEPSGDRNSSRQIGWWVLNFAVCIGFLWLWSRRKSADT
jgi:hypothetical protein